LTGKVNRVQDQGKKGYGLHVRIENDFYYVIYGHLSKVFIEEGKDIKYGDKIGDSGNSGFSTGPHLHFEIRKKPIQSNNGFYGAVNPRYVWYDEYIDFMLVNGIFSSENFGSPISRYEYSVSLRRFYNKIKKDFFYLITNK